MKKKAYSGELIDNIDQIIGIDKLHAKTFDTYRKFPKPHWQFMKKLVSLIEYENVVFMEKTELMKKLHINDGGNLLRSLRQVEHLVVVESSRTDKSVPVGWLKIFVNPLYAYRPSATKCQATLEREFRMFQDLSETSRKDITLSPYYHKVKDIAALQELA